MLEMAGLIYREREGEKEIDKWDIRVTTNDLRTLDLGNVIIEMVL